VLTTGFRRETWDVGNEETAATTDTIELTTVTQNTIMADFHKTLRQDMKQEPPHELDSGERHSFLGTTVFVVLVRERDRAAGIVVSENPAVRDANAVSVTGEVFDHVVRTVEGLLQVAEEVSLI